MSVLTSKVKKSFLFLDFLTLVEDLTDRLSQNIST